MNYTQEIISRLDKCQATGHRPGTIFEDWLDLVEATLDMMPLHLESQLKTGELAQDTPEVTELWKQLRSKYPPDRTVTHQKKQKGYFELFSEAFGILLSAAQTPLKDWVFDTGIAGPDILGDVYTQFTYPNVAAGQYFTPWNVSLLMAQMGILNGEEEIHERIKAAFQTCDDPLAQATLLTSLVVPPEEAEAYFHSRILPVIAPHVEPFKIMEPACGSGIMLLAAATRFPQWAMAWGLVQFYGADIDSTCVKMARINCKLYGLSPTPWVKCALSLAEWELSKLPEPHKTIYLEAQEANRNGDLRRVQELRESLKSGTVEQIPMFT